MVVSKIRNYIRKLETIVFRVFLSGCTTGTAGAIANCKECTISDNSGAQVDSCDTCDDGYGKDTAGTMCVSEYHNLHLIHTVNCDWLEIKRFVPYALVYIYLQSSLARFQIN